MHQRQLGSFDAESCTIGGATGRASRAGAPIIFSNSDDPFTTRTRLVVVNPPDGYRFIATQIVSPPPAVSFDRMYTRGLNAAGFAYTWASVWPRTEPADGDAIGIPYPQFGRLLLSQAATVAEAIELVRRYPRAYHGNFLFADATGELALVEISTQTYFVESRLTDGTIARSNHWISAEMAPVGTEEVGVSSAHRYQRARELITASAGAIDAEALTSITGDHEGRATVGFSICAHGRLDQSSRPLGGSVSSEIIEPQAGRFWYCYGWPCGGEVEDAERQPQQDRSWGAYLPFDLANLPAGEYVTTDGRLTPLGIRSLAQAGSRQSLPALSPA